jgi:predicted RNase H-like HicB family nuclease
MPDHNKSGALRPGTMKKIIQVRIFQGENQYVAECLDLPVVTQAKTLDELTENLREAISLHLKLMFFTRP